jgi:hypothetical protein
MPESMSGGSSLAAQAAELAGANAGDPHLRGDEQATPTGKIQPEHRASHVDR